MLDTLPDDQRQAIGLAFFKGLSQSKTRELVRKLKTGEQKYASVLDRLARSQKNLSQSQEELADKREKSDKLLARIETLEKKNDLVGLRLASLQGQVEKFQQTQAGVVWDQKEGKGLIRLADLPPVEAGKDYQLWIVDPDYDTPVDAGLIQADANGAAEIPFTPADKVTEASAFAISIEKKGGVPVNEGPIVFLGK